MREGAIVTLTGENEHHSQGEIAPLEWFGSESLQEALDFCKSLSGCITARQIFNIADSLPCCQFAFETALEKLQPQLTSGSTQQRHQTVQSALVELSKIAALLPTGHDALHHWKMAYEKGHRTLKWKIGVAPPAPEQHLFNELIQQLPHDCKLRLDANAGLSLKDANHWLNFLDNSTINPDQVEFLEQPLGVDQFAAMQSLAQQYRTPLALDESIANLAQIQTCYQNEWRGVYVIKPAIVGSPKRLAQFVQKHQLDIVCSSVFETEVGYTDALNLSQRIQSNDRAYGFGTTDW